MMLRMLSLLAVLLLASCHWQRSWKWGEIALRKGTVPAVTVRAPAAEPANSWTPVLTDLLARRQDVKLVRTNWEYALWVQVEGGYLSLFCHDGKGRYVHLHVAGGDRFADRELGAGRPKGTANLMEHLQKRLDALFAPGKGARP